MAASEYEGMAIHDKEGREYKLDRSGRVTVYAGKKVDKYIKVAPIDAKAMIAQGADIAGPRYGDVKLSDPEPQVAARPSNVRTRVRPEAGRGTVDGS